jgi:hypothetical protein
MWGSPPPVRAAARAAIASRLAAIEGKHLVFVRYAPGNVYDDWVYNQADIDGARIVWAREMDRWETARTVEYFRRHGRTIWLTEPDVTPDKVEPYQVRWLAPAGE